MKILIVEDDDQVRRGLLRLLEDHDHNVLTAESKNCALGFFSSKSWKTELVISDLDMGNETDGLELLKEALSINPQTRFWLVSAGMTDEIVATAKSMGAEKAISKSRLTEALLEASIIN